MKVYVDEKPKCCEECDLRAENDIGCGYCAAKEYYEDTPEAYETCPLQSLTDHDKQIRKEVVQEIRNAIKEQKEECEEALKDDFHFAGGSMMKSLFEEDLEIWNIVIDIIDQIEGGENGKID